MKKTLNQIITIFQTFAAQHQQIEDFDYNPIQMNFASDRNYPLMFVAIGDANLTPGNVDAQMDVYFLDMLKKDRSNYLQVLSNTLKLCEDFYSTFNNNEDAYGILFTDNLVASPILFEFEDNVIGWKLPITVEVIFNVNEYDIPT
jgi:hypothetical protein